MRLIMSRSLEPLKGTASIKVSLKSTWDSRNEVIILLVMQFVERKGIKYLLYTYPQIRKELNNVVLLMFGSVPLKNNLTKLAHMLEIK